MKKYFSKILFAIICGMFIASCGSGGSGKKLATNGVLGDLPNLVLQKHLTDSIRNAEEEAAMRKLNPNKQSDWAKAMKIDEKFKLRKKTETEKYNAEVEKIKPTLIGKSIPVEVENGLGFEITSSKIINAESHGIQIELELKITDVKAANIMRYAKQIYLTAQNIDKDGNQIGSNGGYYVEISDRANGATGIIKYYLGIYARDAERFSNFAKIKFVKSK